jgi:hypothetical protein
MLSSHLRLGLPSGLLPSGLPTKMLYAPLTSQNKRWVRYQQKSRVGVGIERTTTQGLKPASTRLVTLILQRRMRNVLIICDTSTDKGIPL